MKKDWEVKKLSQVCEKITDGTHQTPTYFQDGIIFLSSKNVTSGKIDWANVKYIDTKQHLEMHKRVAPRVNDILLAKNGTTGVAAIVDKDEVFDIYVSLALLRVKDEILPSFMLYFINSPLAKGQFNGRLKGIGVPNLHLEEIRDVVIYYPKSLSEQQRIVAILDEAFGAIERAKENAQKNLQNARALFESYLQSVFANPGEGWEEKTLGDVLIKTENINPNKNPNKDFIYVDVSSVDNKTLSVTETTVMKGQDAPSRARKLIKTNDIIFATVRPTLKRIAVIPNELNEQVCSTGYFVLRAEKFIDHRFIFYFLQSESFNKKMNQLQKGASYPAVTDGEVREQIIIYPVTLEDQQTIVAKLDALSAETKKLEAIYKQKLTDLDELKKSILQKAFQGELSEMKNGD